MKLEEAQSIIRQVNGKSYTWLRAWGLSTIRSAIRVIYHNHNRTTSGDFELAEDLERVIYRGW